MESIRKDLEYQCTLAYEKSLTDEKFLRKLEELTEKLRTQTQIDQDEIEIGDAVEYYSEREKIWKPTTYIGKTLTGNIVLGTPKFK